MFATVDARDWEALPEHFHPDTVYERPGFPVIEGLSALLVFYREQRTLLHSEHRLTDVVVQGDRGATWGRVSCVLPDDTATEIDFADVYAFREGLIVYRKSHFFIPAV